MSHTMNTPGVAGWIEHTGPDSSAAKRFYQDVCGWKVADLPMKDGSSYPGIMVGESPIGGISPREQASGAWTIFITVESVDEAVDVARKSGGSVVAEPMDMPGVGRMATIEDPFGARLALITYESMQASDSYKP